MSTQSLTAPLGENPKDDVLAYLLKKYGPVVIRQGDLNGFSDAGMRVTIDGIDVDEDTEVTIELVEA